MSAASELSQERESTDVERAHFAQRLIEFWRQAVPDMLAESAYGEAMLAHFAGNLELWTLHLRDAQIALSSGDPLIITQGFARLRLMSEDIELLAVVARELLPVSAMPAH